MRAEEWRREEIVARAAADPSIIVSTSGMLVGGPIIKYAKALLPDPKNRLLLCGFQDADSPGGRLERMADANERNQILKITEEDGRSLRVKVATPVRRYGLSAHSGKDEITKMIAAATPRNVVFVHGEPPARRALISSLQGTQIDVADGTSIHLSATTGR